jgi:hypothetical protein
MPRPHSAANSSAVGSSAPTGRAIPSRLVGPRRRAARPVTTTAAGAIYQWTAQLPVSGSGEPGVRDVAGDGVGPRLSQALGLLVGAGWPWVTRRAPALGASDLDYAPQRRRRFTDTERHACLVRGLAGTYQRSQARYVDENQTAGFHRERWRFCRERFADTCPESRGAAQVELAPEEDDCRALVVDDFEVQDVASGGCHVIRQTTLPTMEPSGCTAQRSRSGTGPSMASTGDWGSAWSGSPSTRGDPSASLSRVTSRTYS